MCFNGVYFHVRVEGRFIIGREGKRGRMRRSLIGGDS